MPGVAFKVTGNGGRGIGMVLRIKQIIIYGQFLSEGCSSYGDFASLFLFAILLQFLFFVKCTKRVPINLYLWC